MIVSKYEGFIVPRAFRFVGGKVSPYEFSFSTIETVPLDGYETFLRDVACWLRSHDLDEVFGIRRLDDYHANLPLGVTRGKYEYYDATRISARVGRHRNIIGI
jgi:hypothetical protein